LASGSEGRRWLDEGFHPADFRSRSQVPNSLYFALSSDNSNVCAQTLVPNDLQTGLYKQDDVPTDFSTSRMIVDSIPQLQAQIQQFLLALYLSMCAAKPRCSIRTSSYISHMHRQSPLCSRQHSQTICAAEMVVLICI
jgi:hypothetical protein